MLKMNLQFFAHKKVLVPRKTAGIPSRKDLAQKGRTGSSF